MASHYASDEIIREIMNGGRAASKAQYIYTEAEATEWFSGVLHEINWIFEAIPAILAIKGNIFFATVASLTPYQVVHLGNGTFVVLVDQRAFYMLLTLCHRVQTLSPFSDHFGFGSVDCGKDYEGKFLLDIVKDFVFHTEDVTPYLQAAQSRLIYQAANTFIMGHEIAHVSHGHLEFLASKDFAQFATSVEDRNFTMRTLEMDADSSATTSVIDVFERHLDHVLASRTPPSGKSAADVRRSVRASHQPRIRALRVRAREKAPGRPTHSSVHRRRRSSPGSGKSAADVRRSVREQYVVGMFIALLYMDALSSNFAPAAYPISYARFLTTSRRNAEGLVSIRYRHDRHS